MKALFLAALLAAPAAAQEISKPRLTVLENGLRVVTVEDRKNPLVAAVWSAHVGDSAEPNEFGGNSHFLEHLLLFRGTKKYPGNAIGDRVSGAGGYFNGHTWYDWTTFEILLPSERLDEILDMHEQMMFEADFKGEDFETEKKAVFEELRSGQDKPYLYLYREAPYKMYDGETYYSRDTIGTIAKVQAATVEKVRRYYRDYYVPSNMTLVLVGDFDTDQALAKVRARFAKRPAGKAAEPPYQARELRPGLTVVSEERKIGKAYFLAAFPSPTASSPDFAAYEVLMSWLGDGNTAPLREELVEKRKLLENVGAEAWPRRYPGGYQVMVGEGDPSRLPAALSALFAELARARAEGIAPERLEALKSRLTSEARVADEDPYSRAMELAKADAHGDYRLAAGRAERLAAVTAEDVWTAADKYLDPSHAFVMALFPEGRTPAGFEAALREGAKAAGAAGGGTMSESALAGGAKLRYDARPGAPVESFSAAIRAGVRDEGAKTGVSEAVAAMLTRLTARRGRVALQDYLDREGIALTQAARMDGTVITVKAPAGKTAALGALLREVLGEPSFAPAEWTETQRALAAGVTAALDQPEPVAMDALLTLLYKDTAYGRGLKAKLAGLQALTPADLAAFHARAYRPERVVVSYSGPAARASVEAALAGRVGAAGAAAAVPEPVIAAAAPGKLVTARAPMAGKKQVNLYWVWPGPSVGSDEWIRWQLASRALGGDLAGRLWNLRQKEGLAYSVWWQDFPYRDRPLTGIYMATAKEKYPDASKALEREIARASAGITQAELERVKGSYLAAIERQDAGSEARTRRHAAWSLAGFGPDYRARLRRVVGETTLEQVNALLKATVDSGKYYRAEAGALD